MSAAPVVLVRGAIDAATAKAWLDAADAHPAWRRREADDVFNPQSSSLRARAVPALAPAAMAKRLLQGELAAFCHARLGDALACNVDQGWVRRQFAPTRYPPGHAAHTWHQDGALGHDFLRLAGTAQSEGLLAMVTCWIALTPCGDGAPGLEWVDDDISELLEPEALTDDAVRARHPHSAWCHAAMQPGDCLAFAGNVLHHTQVAATMRRDRTSVELRLFDARRLPARLHRDLFVAVSLELQGMFS